MAFVNSSLFFLLMVGLIGVGCNPGIYQFQESLLSPSPLQTSSSLLLSYSSKVSTYTMGVPIVENSPNGISDGIFSVSPPLPLGLKLESTTGIIHGIPGAVAPATPYTVTAVGAWGSVSTRITITVNDLPPSDLNYEIDSLFFALGTSVHVNGPSSLGGTVISYSVSPSLPSGLILDLSTGEINGSPTSLVSAGSYTITARNSGGSASTQLTITVDQGFSYSTSPAVYVVGSTIADNIPSFSEGSGEDVTSYSVSPALPAGLSLNLSTGVIWGTPSAVTADTSYTITGLRAGNPTSAILSITVNDKPPSGLSYSAVPLVYTFGSPIDQLTPHASGGGMITLFQISPALPDGLALDTSTGVIHGTPNAVTEAIFYTITASNSGGSTTAVVSIKVNDIAPTGLTYAPSAYTFTVGSPASSSLPTSSGSGVITYSISPSLPDGLQLDTSGRITGSPTTVTSIASYTVTATNSGGSATTSLDITVNDKKPSISYLHSSAIYTVGSPVEEENTPTSSGGTVISYTVSPNLPNGLILNSSTGAIGGTPAPNSVTGATDYTVTATNSGGDATVILTITVKDIPPASVTYATNPATYVTGGAVSNLASTTGGTVATFSVSPPLPTGLSLNLSTGEISGTPTVVTGTATYRVTASNSEGSAGVDLVLTINLGPPLDLAYSSNPAAYSYNIPITTNSPIPSGGAPSSYSITPALPSGLSLNTLTGLITGTPGAYKGATNYSVTATNGAGSVTRTVRLSVVIQAKWTNVYVPPNYTSTLDGNYGSVGVTASTNVPGTREAGCSWTDSDGNFWIFGGLGMDSVHGLGQLNDQWKWDGTNWTWMRGEKTINSPGSIVSPGIPDPGNQPSARYGSSCSKDSLGNIILFGGYGSTPTGPGYLNDIWRWNGTGWASIGFAPSPNPSPTYGVQGTGDTTTNPGGRAHAAIWMDASDNLWLFGGEQNTGSINTPNDFWKWDGIKWTWILGSNTTSVGTYSGTKGPGSRINSAYWKDLSGNFWLLGGRGLAAALPVGYLTDLWKWNGTTWTWAKGTSTSNSHGTIVSPKGVPNVNDYPSARYRAAVWMDASGKAWIFGGQGYGQGLGTGTTDWGTLSDLWQWDGTAWTWVSGPSAPDDYSDATIPAPRVRPFTATPSSSVFYLYGGSVSTVKTQTFTDVWKFTP